MSRDILINLIGRDKASAAVKNVDKAVENLTDSFDEQRNALNKVDKQIESHQENLRKLATQYAKTGDESFTKHIRDQERELRKLTKVSKILNSGDEDRKEAIRFGARLAENVASGLATAGGAISRVLGNVFGSIPPQVQVAIGAGVAGAAAAALPVLGGAIAAAIVGGVGIGGVIGGLAIAARHSAVKSSAALVGQTFKDTMQSAGVAFVPATMDALNQVRAAIIRLGPSLQRVFSRASAYVKPLTEGVIGFVEKLMPGIESAVANAGPIIREISNWLPKLGETLSKGFISLAQVAPTAARALGLVFQVINVGVQSTFVAVRALTELYRWLDAIGKVMSGNIDDLMVQRAADEAAKEGNEQLAESLKALMAGFEDAASSAANATSQIRSLKDILNEGASNALNARAATRGLEEAIDAATESLKSNGATLDDNTPKGRANAVALDAIASAANQASAAIFAETGSQETANAAAERGRAKFIELAVKMGMSREAAAALARTLIAIPSVERKVSIQDAQAKAAIQAIKSGIATIHDKSVTVTVKYETRGSRQGEHTIGVGTNLKGLASGGPMEAGRPYIVGENGPELITPTKSGYVHNATDTSRILSQARSRNTVVPEEYGFAKDLLNELKSPKRGDRFYEDFSWTGMSNEWDDPVRFGLSDRLNLDWRKPGDMIKALERYIAMAEATSGSSPRTTSSASSSSSVSGGINIFGDIILNGVQDVNAFVRELRKYVRQNGGNVQVVLGK